MSNTDIKEIVGEMTNLETLHITGKEKLTAETIETISQPNLKDLSLHDFLEGECNISHYCII